jgi:hypothetical protein
LDDAPPAAGRSLAGGEALSNGTLTLPPQRALSSFLAKKKMGDTISVVVMANGRARLPQ